VSVAVFAFYAVKAGKPEAHTVALQRGFFGILRVLEGGESAGDPWTLLRNGTTRHGMQFRSPDWRRTATTYYGTITGVGIVLRGNRASGIPRKVGVVGLGVGTLAAYGREGDEFIFYEIDPEVVELAADTRYFSYLEDTSAKLEIVLGDARLSLESELRDTGSRAFDLLVIDAFSSDSIPMHLLTREAFELYDRHLVGGGLLAVHITNRHLELGPLVFRLGLGLGMQGIRILSADAPKFRSGKADWIILARNEAYLQQLSQSARAHGAVFEGEPLVKVGRPLPGTIARYPLWTDDYSNIFSALKPIWPQAGRD
jgi:hypothetical protein